MIYIINKENILLLQIYIFICIYIINKLWTMGSLCRSGSAIVLLCIERCTTLREENKFGRKECGIKDCELDL